MFTLTEYHFDLFSNDFLLIFLCTFAGIQTRNNLSPPMGPLGGNIQNGGPSATEVPLVEPDPYADQDESVGARH